MILILQNTKITTFSRPLGLCAGTYSHLTKPAQNNTSLKTLIRLVLHGHVPRVGPVSGDRPAAAFDTYLSNHAR